MKKLKTIKVDHETWKALKRLSTEKEKSIGNLIKEKFMEGKEMINKNNISVDHPQQNIEKNIGWQDYPCINTEIGKKLRHNLGYYFESWDDYLQNGNDINYDTK